MCGESFPVGCQHSANITAAEYFCVNPDRRRRMYNTPTGMYAPGCGLGSVMMSWSGCVSVWFLGPHPSFCSKVMVYVSWRLLL